MKTPKRLLLLEDDPNDYELIRRTVWKEWPECELVRVSSQSGFEAALAQGGFDVILSDYNVPAFDGASALALVRTRSPELPFIFVSGAIGDDVAVECLKAGATDYVLKDRMARLLPAIRRAKQESEERIRRRAAEKESAKSHEQYRDLCENASDLIQFVTADGHFTYVNPAWKKTLGYEEDEISNLTVTNIIHPDYHAQWRKLALNASSGDLPETWESIFLTKSGKEIHVEGNVGAQIASSEVVALRGIFHDITERKLAAMNLQRSVRQYESLVNSVDGIVWQAELPSLRFTFISQQAERLLGYSVRSWIEQQDFWQNHIHPDDRDKAVTICLKMAAGAKPESFEYRMIAADGREVWLRDIVNVRAEKGQQLQLQGIMVDCTRRKRAEIERLESQALKTGILEASLDAIIVMDVGGTVIEFNPAAETTFGYRRSEIIGQSLAEKIIPPDQRARHCEGIKNYLNNGRGTVLGKRIVVQAMRSNGEEFPAEMAIVPLRLSDRTVFTAYIRDITKRKRSEQALRRAQTKLKQSNQYLLRQNQEIQNFYHTLSHELKTPLTSAREFVSIVLDGLAGPLTENQTKYLNISKDSCDQMRVCINDLFDATRLETGKLPLELKPVSLSNLLPKVVTLIGQAASEKEITLECEAQADLPEALLDETRITQVVTNLISNALKYTPPGGKVVVKTAEVPGRPELLQVSVSDNGCGIAPEEQERIFDRLYQIKAGDAATQQGVGLGLYLCKELVELHGGTIWLESRPGKGSTFSFVLPRNGKLATQSDILVIDDDADMNEMLRLLLSNEQYNVRTALDGQEGLQEIKRQKPDVIILDLVMPKLNGPATLQEIRRICDQVPIIVHTGFAGGDLMKEAFRFSPFTLLAKPSSPEQIIETVRKVNRASETQIWSKNQLVPQNSSN